MTKTCVCLIGGLIALWANQTHAATYINIDSSKSKIEFVYKQMNVPMEGEFRRFGSQINFDSANLAASNARFDIELESIDTGALDADEEVRGKLWFNTKVFPRAVFVSKAIKPLGAASYDVSGTLTIKGITRDVRTTVTMRPAGDQAVFQGTLVIKRADFMIGEGMWADFGTVANDVQIRFSLLAQAGKAQATKK